MSPVIQKFRSAFNGFNRQDVLTYIEQITLAHRRESNSLQSELEACRKERDDLQATLAGMEDERGGLVAEEARVRACLEESTATLTHLWGEVEETGGQLAAAKSELERCKSELAELSPMARCYEELKDRVATIELDAHRKAQATVDEAKAEADALRQETRLWLEQVLTEYEALRSGVESLFHCVRGVAAMEKRLTDFTGRMDELKRLSGDEEPGEV